MTTRRPGRPQDDIRARVSREIDDELTFHHENTLAELKASGLGPAEAEAEARRRFGPAARYRSRLVDIDIRTHVQGRRRAAMSAWSLSVRSAVRGVWRSPTFTIGVVAVLTLGLGVNAITLGLVDRLVLSGPSGLHRPDDLRRVVVHRQARSGAEVVTTEMGYLDYQDLLKGQQLAGAAGESETPLLYGAGDTAERIQAKLVTANYFTLLGVQPALGRFFTTDESAREDARVVVLSHAFWARQFGSAADVIGRVLAIESHRYTVVGVAPKYFTGTAVRQVDVFLPLEAAADEQIAGPWRTSRGLRWMGAVVRLAPGASVTAATEELTALHREGSRDVPGADARAALQLVPLNAVRGETADGELSVAALVGAVALFVLLIAFANVANLFLARALRRRDAIAIRLALGGSRARLIVEQAIEGALIALAGAIVAVSVAVFGAHPVQTVLFPEIQWLEAPVPANVLLFLAAVAITGGALSAALPIWQAGRTDLTRWLKTGGQRVSRTRTQGAMVLVQGALSVLLLLGAGLFIRSLIIAESVDLGVDASRLLIVAATRGEAPLRADFQQALRGAVERIPGVEGTTSAAGTVPFVSGWAVSLTVPGLPEPPRVEDGGPYISAVEPGYFERVGTSVFEGRAFATSDREGSPSVTIVNRSMARLFWPGESALGKCLRIGRNNPSCSTVVGVVENTRRQAIVEGDSLLYYVPSEQAPADLRTGRLIVRVAADDSNTMSRVREAIRREALNIEPNLRYVNARPLDDIISPQLRSWRLGAGLFSAFGLLALVVAAVGLYSVMAFDVEGRRREIGVRAALGASSRAILSLVIGDGLRLAAAGMVLGIALAWLSVPLIADLLYGGASQDPAVYAIVLGVLTVISLVASAVPGLRAARLDPSATLRDE